MINLTVSPSWRFGDMWSLNHCKVMKAWKMWKMCHGLRGRQIPQKLTANVMLSSIISYSVNSFQACFTCGKYWIYIEVVGCCWHIYPPTHEC